MNISTQMPLNFSHVLTFLLSLHLLYFSLLNYPHSGIICFLDIISTRCVSKNLFSFCRLLLSLNYDALCYADAFNFLRSHIKFLINAYSFGVLSRMSFPVLTSSRLSPNFLSYQI